jgi:two-component system response regulator PilR (NtrC family)
LENILERAMALHEEGIIELDDLNLSTHFPNCPIKEISEVMISDYDAEKMSLESYLLDIEKKALTTALEENRWNKTAAARQLGMTFRSFRYRLKKLGLE